jgi:hypothetical protein
LLATLLALHTLSYKSQALYNTLDIPHHAEGASPPTLSRVYNFGDQYHLEFIESQSDFPLRGIAVIPWQALVAQILACVRR